MTIVSSFLLSDQVRGLMEAGCEVDFFDDWLNFQFNVNA